MRPGCKCGKLIKAMDAGGPDWCRKNMEQIINAMEEEAHKRKMPFSRIIAKRLIMYAIKKQEVNDG